MRAGMQSAVDGSCGLWRGQLEVGRRRAFLGNIEFQFGVVPVTSGNPHSGLGFDWIIRIARGHVCREPNLVLSYGSSLSVLAKNFCRVLAIRSRHAKRSGAGIIVAARGDGLEANC